MNHAAMLELLSTKPFKPFDVITSGGQIHRVLHPEFVVLTKTQIVIVDPDADRVAVLQLLHVTEARFESTARA